MNGVPGGWELTVKNCFRRILAVSGVNAEFVDPSGIVFTGLVDYLAPTQAVLTGMQLSDDHTAEYIPEDFPGLAYGSQITITLPDLGAVVFTVREANKTDDGFTSRATLTKD